MRTDEEILEIIKKCAYQAIRERKGLPRTKWLDLRTLYGYVKKHKIKLSKMKEIIMKEYQRGWDAGAPRMQLSRASTARPHIERYGVLGKWGVYYYIKFEK